METNDSPLKPQPTGGLKLMTVFIAVLVLHVLVIGTFTIYHLMSAGTTDTDLLAHKAAKDAAVASDGQMPDASTAGATTPADTAGTTTPAAPADGTSTGVAAASPATDPAAPTATSDSAPAIASTPPTTGTPTATAPLASDLATTPPEIAPVPATAAEVASGPVKMPPTQPDVEMTAVSAPEPDAGAPEPYVVKSHDTLGRIARHNHTTVAELKSANNLTTDFLRINQKLIIPNGGTMTATGTTVASTGPSSMDASGPIMAPSDVAPSVAAPAHHLKAMSTASISGWHHHVYTVVKGDTLTRIAHKFKTTATALMAANSITDPTKLSIGKKLKIPSQESRSAKNMPPRITPPAAAQAGAPTAQLANFVQ